MNKPLISLCMPTNGVIEWVFPVLESIYNQRVNNELFEVVITDNGNNTKFKKAIKEYLSAHTNIVYAETQALPFMNEIESYKRASGLFIKFINHRTLLLPGALDSFISFVMNNIEEKPFIYFGNGIINEINGIKEYQNFNDFVEGLSYWSSWSTGMAFWREDFSKIMQDQDVEYNELFPHTDILFGFRNKKTYLIDNRMLLKELSDDGIPKGKYDLFYAFAVEYLYILLQLVRDGDLSVRSFNTIKAHNLLFIMEQYHAFVIKKRPCSYILNNYLDSINVFYGQFVANWCYRRMRVQQVYQKIKKIIKRKER